MSKRGRALAKKPTTATVALSIEHRQILEELARGHNLPLGRMADIVFAKGLEGFEIEESFIKVKRIIDLD